MDNIPAKILLLPDGRNLSYAEYGDPQGRPLIGFHGMPGSRYFMSILDAPARQAGLRLVAPERPGYGGSSPWRGGLLDYTRDVLALADALKFERFAVLGVSG